MKAFVIRKQGTEREILRHKDGPNAGLFIGFEDEILATNFCLVELGTTEGVEIIHWDFNALPTVEVEGKYDEVGE